MSLNCCVFTQAQLLQPCFHALFTVVNSKEDLGTRLNSPLSIIFFWFWYCGYYTDGPKTALPEPKQKHAKSSLKTKHVAWTKEPNIGLTYTVLL